VSARTGAGVDKLLEAILLQAEVLELSARATGSLPGCNRIGVEKAAAP